MDPRDYYEERARHFERARARLAYHEAGHAVLRFHAREPIALVSINPDSFDGSGGRVEFVQGVERSGDLVSHACCLIAGPVAEILARHASADEACAPGREDLDRAALAMFCEVRARMGDAAKLQGLVRHCVARTELLLRRYWSHVQAVAQALLIREVLTGDELAALLAETPLRPMAGAERFFELLELGGDADDLRAVQAEARLEGIKPRAQAAAIPAAISRAGAATKPAPRESPKRAEPFGRNADGTWFGSHGGRIDRR
jgi:hypothetical protein